METERSRREDVVEELSVPSHDVIHDHEAVKIAFWFTITTDLLSIIGLFDLPYNIRWQNTLFGIRAIATKIK